MIVRAALTVKLNLISSAEDQEERGKLEIMNNIPMTPSELHDGIELCVSYTQHQGLESLFGW